MVPGLGAELTDGAPDTDGIVLLLGAVLIDGTSDGTSLGADVLVGADELVGDSDIEGISLGTELNDGDPVGVAVGAFVGGDVVVTEHVSSTGMPPAHTFAELQQLSIPDGIVSDIPTSLHALVALHAYFTPPMKPPFDAMS